MDIRVIFHPPADGAWNMAVDEALLETVCQSNRIGWLRFYLWQEPTLSLGYFQQHADRQLHAASRDCPLVRRSTGGGAILHAQELTYSLVVPLQSHWDQQANVLYRAAHETLIDEFASRGLAARTYGQAIGRDSNRTIRHDEPFLCFQRRDDADILLDEHKIVGSAQRRRRLGLLQHGSILLATTKFSPELAGIRDISGKLIEPWDLAQPWSQRLTDRLEWRLQQRDALDEPILQLARQWLDNRFARSNWILRR